MISILVVETSSMNQVDMCELNNPKLKKPLLLIRDELSKKICCILKWQDIEAPNLNLTIESLYLYVTQMSIIARGFTHGG